MKKIIAFLLACIMTLSVCAFSVAEEELATVKILAKGAPEDSTRWMDFASGRAVADALAKRGVKLEVECVDPASLGSIISTRMAAGVELPDLVSAAWCGITSEEVMQWGHDGLVYSINELCEKYDEDGSIFAFQNEKAPGTMIPDMDEDGNIWYFSYLYAPKRHIIGTDEMLTKNPYATLIRKDWLDKVGVEYKMVWSPEELYDVVMKFRKADVNGSGKEDEVVAVNFDNFNLNLARSFGLVTPLLAGLDADEKTVVSNFYNDKLVTYLTFMNKLYENGMLDTSTMVRVDDESKNEVLTQNRAAVYYHYANWANAEKVMNVPEGNALLVPIILDETGSVEDGWYGVADIAGSTMNYYFVPTACKHPENVVKVMDYVYSEEYAILNEIGNEGDYNVDEKGIYMAAPPRCESDDDEVKKQHFLDHATSFQAAALGLNMLPAMRVMDNWVYDLNPAETNQVLIAKAMATRDIMGAQKKGAIQRQNQDALYAVATEEQTETLNEITEALRVYASEMVVEMILGKRDISTLDEGVAQMEELGLKDYMEIMQERRDRALALEAALK